MNGANDGNQNNPGQALWLPQNAIVTPEEYRRNQERLAAYRQSLAQMEHENEEAYRRYTLAEQELRNRVEQGKKLSMLLFLRPTGTVLDPFVSLNHHSVFLSSPSNTCVTANAFHESCCATLSTLLSSSESLRSWKRPGLKSLTS